MWNCPYSNDSFPVYAEEVGRVGDKAAKASKGQGLTLVHFSAQRKYFLWDTLRTCSR